MTLSHMGLSPENGAIAKRLFPDFDARDTGANQIEALMNAARAEGAGAKKRFWLYAGDIYYPSAGAVGDFRSTYETAEQAIEAGKSSINEYQWWSVEVATESGPIRVARGDWKEDARHAAAGKGEPTW